jgi:hypothetical protein
MMLVVVPGEELGAESMCVLITATALGKLVRYFMVLNWLSEYGLSLETYGRLWVLVTPSSASKKATNFELIGAPRSACTMVTRWWMTES